MISHSKKFLFIHPPKVGGNSIHAFLKEYYHTNARLIDNRSTKNSGREQGVTISMGANDLNKHGTISYWYNIFPESREYYKFSVIRNPWDRMVSWFSWWTKNTLRNDSSNKQFEAFCDKFELEGWFHPFSSFFKHEGDDQMDFIMEFENFDRDFKHVLESLSIPLDSTSSIPHLNSSFNETGPHYSDLYKFKNGTYNDGLIEWVYLKHKEDFKYKKYKFGD